MEGEDESSRAICTVWDGYANSVVTANFIPLAITLINLAIRSIVTFVAEYVRKETNMEKISFMRNWIFLLLFLQLGVMVAFAAVSLREFEDTKFIKNFFGGIYTDFNDAWFKDVGTLILDSMILNMVMPIFTFIQFYMTNTFFRMMDVCVLKECKCCPREYKDTNSKTIFQFLEIYHGSEFQVYYAYAYLQYVIFICFMYGGIMPVLFPIGLISLALHYLCERLKFFYSYKKPPAIPKELWKSTLKQLYIAPILYLAFSCYAYSNRQLFFDDKVPILDPKYIFPLADHKFSDFLEYLSPASVILIPLFYCIYRGIIEMATIGRVFNRNDLASKKRDLLLKSFTKSKEHKSFSEKLYGW